MDRRTFSAVSQLLLAMVITTGHYYCEQLATPLNEKVSNRRYVSPTSRFSYTDHKSESMCKQKNTSVDCVGLGIKEVPQHLDLNITYLDLSNNKIENLGNILMKYINLVYLNISNNQLHKLKTNNFLNLSKLLYLDLEGNYLAMDESFPRFVFKPLSSLTSLKINYNNRDLTDVHLEYPDKALSELRELTHLYMDGLLNKSLGFGFKKLTSLKNLTLSGPKNGQCSPVSVQNDTFINVANLTFLNITGCCINGHRTNSGVFNPLTNLKVLDISGNEQQCLDDLTGILNGLQKSNLSYLRMSNVINIYTPCVTVTKIFVEILPIHLKTLIVSSNSFEMMEDDVMDSLPKTLFELDISDNRFTFGAYLQNFTKLENLKILSINKGTLSFRLPTKFPDVKRCTSYYHQSSSIMASDTLGLDKSLLKLPQKLDEVRIEYAGWSYSLTTFSINPKNSLKKLSLTGNNIPSLVGPITGLIALEELDLVQCSIYSISENFFDTFPALVKLNLSSNFFGMHSLHTGSNPLFKSLTKLTYLDLSFVNILTISNRTFEGLDNLEKVWLQNNAFYYFDVYISHMKNLQFIDFRFTELATLTRSTIEALKNISQNNNLSIDFSQTPIHCFCENMFFLDWVVTSNIFHKNLTDYKCVFLDTSEKYVTKFDTIYQKLVKECTSQMELFTAILCGTILVICFILGSIVYRFRWKIKYLYYSAYLSFKLKEGTSAIEDDFTYDVFMSYVSDDQNFVIDTLVPQLKSRGLKVHVHAFDFVAGEYIASNIVNAIQNSRHTLVVLTRSLLKSVWCRYELQMANMENVHTGRSVLVFLLMENLTKRELGTELLYHIQNNTYIKYPEVEHHHDEPFMEVFWTKLVEDLRNN